MPINVSKSTAFLLLRQQYTSENTDQWFLGKAIQWVETAHYLGLTLDTQVTWSAHVNKVENRVAQRLGVPGSLLNRRSGLSVRNGVLLC
jgi:hypothetical protein